MFQTFLHHPRKLWLRRALFQVHLWAGILLSLYIVVIGTTGALLVFEDEFSILGQPRGAFASEPAPVSTVIRMAEAKKPGEHVTFVTMPTPEKPHYEVYLQNAAGKYTEVAADMATGAVRETGRSWIEWVHDLHTSLLMGNIGVGVNAVAAMVLLLLAISGIFLWWPGVKTWVRGLRINFRSGWRRINFDAHNAIGFWTLAIVSWWAISGIYFGFPRQVAAVVGVVSPLKNMKEPEPLKEVAASGQVSLESILEKAHNHLPAAFLSGFGLTGQPGGNVTVYMDVEEPGDFSHRDILTYSGGTGNLLATWHYGQNQTLGDWVMWAMYPLHFGTLWGVGWKVVWFCLGLSLAVLSITGLLMYWNRWLRHRWKTLRGAASSAPLET